MSGSSMRRLRSAPQSNKSSDLPSGVSVFVERGRRPGSTPSVTFGVYFRTPDGPDVRKFRASVAADDGEIAHTRETAIAFRACFNHCVREGLPFDPAWYADWRSRKLYPFDPALFGA